MRISILLIVCLLTGSLKAADPVRLDDLGRLRTVSQLTLDPSGGRAVAVVDGFSGVDPQAKKIRELWLIDLEDGRLPRVLTQSGSCSQPTFPLTVLRCSSCGKATFGNFRCLVANHAS